MRSPRPKSRIVVAGFALLTLFTVPGPAPADVYFETVYGTTSSVLAVPTSSVLSTSYVVPSSYLSTTYLPTSYTSYIPTSYTSSYIPTSYTSSYIPTSAVVSTDSVLVPTTTTYYRPSIFRSRRFYDRTSYSYVPTSYSTLIPTTYSTILPTTYIRSSLVPTTYLYDDSVVTTSMASDPCDTRPSVAPTRAINRQQSNNNNGPVLTSEPTNAGNSNERRPTSNFNSNPSNVEGPSSRVDPPVTVPSATPPPPTPKETPKTGDTGAALAEPPPLGSGTPAAPKPQPTGTGAGANEVIIPPPGSGGNSIPGPNEMQYRESRRPSYDTRNILRGKVYSADSKRTEEGIIVILSNLTGKFADRQAMTDADGEFKVSLPDGDWVVKVKMPSGSIVSVGKEYVTASNGKVTNASGQPVEVTITR